MNAKRIVIFNWADFTKSTAVTSRIKAYGKGLQFNGVDVDVVITTPNYIEENLPMEGTSDGIHYMYIQKRSYRDNFILKIFKQIAHFLLTLKLLYKLNNKRKIDFAFLSFDTTIYMWYYNIICHIIGIKTVFVADEYPVAIRDFGLLEISNKDRLLYKYVLPFYSARVFINQQLVDYYNKIRSLKDSYVLSTIIDTERFYKCVNKSTNEEYLCYMGGMDLTNDNVDLIIEAFQLIKDKYPKINLYLYGTPNNRDLQILEELILKYHLENRVVLKGRVSYKEVPSVLSCAKVMVTSQSKTKRAEGGLPTKVGEYLMSGKPSIMSDVSTISKFLTNGKHVFIVEPDNIDKYKDLLVYILDHYDESLAVAKKGREYIELNYSNQVQAKKMLDFLEKI